jgi:hypothetical protein
MRRRAGILIGAVLVLGVSARASEETLSESSPFAPFGNSRDPTGAAEHSPLELRGIMSTPEGTRFCIYDCSRNLSVWAAVNEWTGAFVINSSDIESDTVTVAARGRLMVLALRSPRVVPAPLDAQTADNADSKPLWTMTRRLPGAPRAPVEKPGS